MELATIDPTPVVEATPSLDELAATVQAEHAQCMTAMRTTVEHAIRAGEALLLAREQTLKSGVWTSWMATNFPGNRKTAYCYMPLATYKDQVPPGYGVAAAERLVSGLPAIDGVSRSRISDVRKAEAQRLRLEEKKSYKEIAKELGTSVSTVHSWFNGTKAGRNKRARRALRAAEKERSVRRAVTKAGGALAETYSLAERLDDVLGQAHRDATDPEARRDLARAHEFQRAMRDSIVRALGVG